ncbi:SUKH-4 family immunity protein [Streptomyces sp. VRA16 Mangrove soil]|uniref:SUKH-4 family immunity protein n=1 Tax=Streptomyces sp. VRA16 Mangrove soil TaxID=2817434 RepID=UPI001A9E2CFB|nr:SUKH-4 family immunity protein [Streptomyces sp. VRA16 Mangrove soil]MBO1336297.1 SUKH-4 family immunity protein [Streptomyces sp. VRA16 Mangrove soil]
MDRDLQEKFDDSIRLPLCDLMGPEFQASRISQDASWGLPARDEKCLRRYGVPVTEAGGGPNGVQLVGDVQTGVDPEMEWSTGAAYRLGRYWKRTVGTLESGVVVAVFTGEGERVSYVNSTVCAFVETAWRWSYAKTALSGMTGDPDQLYDDLARFFELACAIDPEVGEETRFRWWAGIVAGW